jgi:DNA-binding NtrC family response regulator
LIVNALIVDDTEEIRNTLSAVLESEGYVVETVENGKEAINFCKKVSFDVALIDVNLPDVKGTDLLPRLQEIRPKMVKIIVTGYPSIENAAKSVNEKADGYIIKPIDPAKLLEMIDRLIKEKQNEYLHMFSEVERAKESTPIFRYQHPEKW